MTLLDIIMKWLPLLLVFVVLIVFFRSKRVGWERTMTDQLDEVRRNNQILERQAQSLERIATALERGTNRTP